MFYWRKIHFGCMLLHACYYIIFVWLLRITLHGNWIMYLSFNSYRSNRIIKRFWLFPNSIHFNDPCIDNFQWYSDLEWPFRWIISCRTLGNLWNRLSRKGFHRNEFPVNCEWVLPVNWSDDFDLIIVNDWGFTNIILNPTTFENECSIAIV